MRPAFSDEKHAVEITRFDGGYNTRLPKSYMPLNHSPAIQNMMVDEIGAVKTRSGFTTIGNGTVFAGYNYITNSSVSYLVALIPGNGSTAKLAYLSGTAFTSIPSSVSDALDNGIFAGGTTMDFVTARGYLVVSDGSVDPYKWNATEFTRLNASAPTQTASIACNAAGSLTGTYEYVYLGVNSLSAETDYGPKSNSITVASGVIRVTNIPTAPVSHGIESWKVARNTAGASGVFYIVTSVTNGVTSLTDTAADSALVTAAPTDRGAPRKFKYMLVFKGRLWGAGESSNPNYLWFSNLNQPCEFPSTNFIRIGDGDGFTISGLGVLNDFITVHKSDGSISGSIWTLFVGDSGGVSDPDNWYLKKINSIYGANSHKSICNFDGKQGFMTKNGYFAISGTDVVMGSADNQKGTLEPEEISFNVKSKLVSDGMNTDSTSQVFNYDNKLWVSEYQNTISWVYDYSKDSDGKRRVGAWIRNTTSGSFAQLWNFLVYNSFLTAFDRSQGKVYKMDSGTNDDANGIPASFQTASIVGKDEHSENTKTFRYLVISLTNLVAATLSIAWYLDDSATSTGTTTVDLTPATNQAKKIVKVRIGATGKNISFLFSLSTLDKYFKLNAIKVMYNLKGLRSD